MLPDRIRTATVSITAVADAFGTFSLFSASSAGSSFEAADFLPTSFVPDSDKATEFRNPEASSAVEEGPVHKLGI